MPSIDDDLMRDFEVVVLETLVPLRAQRQAPEIRRLWADLIQRPEVRRRLETCFRQFSRSSRSVGEAFRGALSRRDENVLFLRTRLYREIGRSEKVATQFFGRRITNGNEQCPYWDGFSYAEKPRELSDRAGA